MGVTRVQADNGEGAMMPVCGGAAMMTKMPVRSTGNAWANPFTAAAGEMIAGSGEF